MLKPTVNDILELYIKHDSLYVSNNNIINTLKKINTSKDLNVMQLEIDDLKKIIDPIFDINNLNVLFYNGSLELKHNIKKEFYEYIENNTNISLYIKNFKDIGINIDMIHIYYWAVTSINIIASYKMRNIKNYNEIKDINIDISKNNFLIQLITIIRTNIINLKNLLINKKKIINSTEFNDIFNLLTNIDDSKNKIKYIAVIIYDSLLKLNVININYKWKSKIKNKNSNIWDIRININSEIYLKTLLNSMENNINFPYLTTNNIYKYNLSNYKNAYKFENYRNENVLLSDKTNLHININDKYIDVLNHLYKQPFTIDKIYLEHIKNMSIYDIQNIYKNIDFNVSIKYLEKNIFLNHEETHIEIQNKIFIQKIFILDCYKEKNIYFNHGCDTRGRIYNKHWPLNPYNDKFLTPSLRLGDIKYFDLNISKTYINNIYYNIKDYWSYYIKIYDKYSIKPINDIIKDASCSGLQMLGGFIKDKNILYYTNIYNYSNNKECVYDHMKNIYKLWITENIDNIYKKYYKIFDNDKVVENFNDFINRFTKLDRKFFKNILMTHNYNEGLEKSTEKFCIKLELDYENKKIVSIIKWFRNNFIKLFYINFPLMKIVNEIIEFVCLTCIHNNKPILFKFDSIETHYVYQEYLKKESIRVYHGSEYTKKSSIYYLKKNDKIMSLHDNKRSITANLMHYLDSCLVTKVVLECKKLNIPISTNHDCFRTTIEYDEKILLIYNEKYIELFNNNMIENFIEYNETKILSNNITNNNIYNKQKIKFIENMNIYNKMLENNELLDISKLDINKIKYSIS